MRKALAVVVGLAACGGPAKGPQGPTGGGDAGGGAGPSKPMGPGDVAFEVQAQEIKGNLYEPDALGQPGMPLVEAKKKTTLDKQRQAYEKSKDIVTKQANAAILATMLYQKSKETKGDEQKQLWTDARQVLRDVQQAAGDKADEITLRLVGTYEIMLGDYAAAEKAWDLLIRKTNPKDKELSNNKAWWGYALLKQHKNSEALSAVGNEAISEKTPELAYIVAWAKWRTGDKKGGWDAIVTSAKGWGTEPGRDQLDADILLFAGRGDMTVDATTSALAAVYGKDTNQQYTFLSNLGLKAYLWAGRWTDGVAVLDKAMTTAGAKVPPNDRVSIRYTQADYTVRLDDPVTAAKYAKEAIDALPGCGTKCSDKDKNAIVQYVFSTAQLFHVVYATAHDDRYYQPAHDLYALTVPKLVFDDKLRAEGQKLADQLERSFKAMKAGVGTHDKAALSALIGRHVPEVIACYEEALGANPKLAGNLTVNLEADQTGAVKGVSTEPKGGAEGISAVAACVETRARNWKLPSRAQAGTTRIKASYSLSPKK